MGLYEYHIVLNVICYFIFFPNTALWCIIDTVYIAQDSLDKHCMVQAVLEPRTIWRPCFSKAWISPAPSSPACYPTVSTCQSLPSLACYATYLPVPPPFTGLLLYPTYLPGPPPSLVLLALSRMPVILSYILYSIYLPVGRRWAGVGYQWSCPLCKSPPTPPPWGASRTRREWGSAARSSSRGSPAHTTEF